MQKTISVLGLGYIGLSTAIILANAKHKVKGYDVKKEVVKTLQQGHIHVVEEHLQELFERVTAKNNLEICDDLKEADIYMICVPTPFIGSEKKVDLSYIKEAALKIAPKLKENDIVILESTVPPKTTRMLAQLLENESKLSRDQFHVAHCPERVLPGQMVYELQHNDRIIGSDNLISAQLVKELYETFVTDGTCYITDDVTAEMCKLVENTYRDINIAFSNELSIICDQLGIEVNQLIELANKHPRVNVLSPGVGVGGHCIAVDPWFLVEMFSEANLIKTARQINDKKPYYIANKIDQILKQKKEIKIGLLGLSYKPNIDDLRESPSLLLADLLKGKGYQIYGCEPNISKNHIKNLDLLTLKEILIQCNYLILAQPHQEFIKEKQKILEKPHFLCTKF